jgi:N-acetylmuramic acid 6-phosphate etherase
MADFPDPIALRRQVALKMLLNAHSTATMAILGRLVGNTMTNVSPSNLKLIGRATFLVQSHVNDTIARAKWVTNDIRAEEITFAEANAVLFEAMEYVRSAQSPLISEVALSIVRVLEALHAKSYVSWDLAAKRLGNQTLGEYLERCRVFDAAQ